VRPDNLCFTAFLLLKIKLLGIKCCAFVAADDDPHKMQQSGGDEAGPSNDTSGSQGLQLGAVESHWRTETDYYAATVALDVLSFAFVALFYQVKSLLPLFAIHYCICRRHLLGQNAVHPYYCSVVTVIKRLLPSCWKVVLQFASFSVAPGSRCRLSVDILLVEFRFCTSEHSVASNYRQCTLPTTAWHEQ